MSTHDSGIPLTHVPDSRGYKLMELPPELEALLTAEDVPVVTLTSTPATALLKAQDKTYKLLQKNTSNSLILLAPHTSDVPAVGLAAIATVHETIELIAQAEPQTISNLKNTGSKGKWHEKFGRGR
ncbi:Putative sister chromatid cohesion protein Dcc1 [Colletotrichum destructivum]|uniref:Sister chromatid cohesion protein Dcc1 n=1 Tax=Colletotrichum destructivum TaxID=34406 RepID=A0AAX4IR25_9PEZI|nr:Putative sister chromatid cohesion protein Dcc1 [Colletotrichum destructivum]